MSIDATMAVLYAQTGLAAPLANAAAVAPQASLAMSRVLAAEMARQEQQQIEKTEKTESPNIVPDGRGGGNAHFGSRRRRRPPLHEAEDDESRASSSPLVGNLLNVKV
ncbi:hypothetical protein [uncultured Desulfovibrio sp.]|uniref:hypothetical protein n=1 Tax=uncultured Desulfovibrio sp. TaxID=167968 RepID=UPI0003A01167|nr:hypothetical protein [uncultured Desulfovibrio sp.]